MFIHSGERENSVDLLPFLVLMETLDQGHIDGLLDRLQPEQPHRSGRVLQAGRDEHTSIRPSVALDQRTNIEVNSVYSAWRVTYGCQRGQDAIVSKEDAQEIVVVQ
jgi:hypothetical protein